MTKKQSKPEPSKVEQFKALTWIELTNWAGSTIVSRGKTYQQGKRVSQLAKTPDGKLVAWVKGTDIYATQVEINADGSLDSNCYCPYWATCKRLPLCLNTWNTSKQVRMSPLQTVMINVFRNVVPVGMMMTWNIRRRK